MKFLLSLGLLFCGIFHIQSQDLYLDPSTKDLLFDREILLIEKITIGVMKISYKYDKEVINTSDNEVYYHFDKDGFIKDRILIDPFKKRRDSVVTIYYRDNNGFVTTKVEHDHSFTSVDLYYYSDEKIIKQESYQMKRDLNWNESLYPEKLMWSDSISYLDSQIEVYNRFGTKYKVHKLGKNSSGEITEIKSYNRGGKLEKTISIFYSGKDIISIKEENNNKLMYNWKKEFKYNEHGLEEEKYYKEDQLEYIRRISYNEKGLPELDLKRNEETGKMSIYKITYYQ